MVMFDRPEWQADAACRDRADIDWFPEGRGETARKAYDRARAICNLCLVQDECGQYAIDENIKFGMWGGLEPYERHDNRMVRSGQKKPIPHGTEAGYKQHRIRHIAVCEPCRDAHARYNAGGRKTTRGLRVIGEIA